MLAIDVRDGARGESGLRLAGARCQRGARRDAGADDAEAAAIFGGNSLAERIRPRLAPRTTILIEYVTLVVCVALSLARIR